MHVIFEGLNAYIKKHVSIELFFNFLSLWLNLIGDNK